MGKIILIGGAPAVGKSYLAQQLSLKLAIPWISTDQIRSLMQDVVEKEEYPHLFDSEGLNPLNPQKEYSPQEIVELQNRQSAEVWKGVLAFILKNDLWKSYIIEGIAILPQFIARDLKNHEEIRPLFLLEKNEERVKNVIKNRGMWGDPSTYSDNVKTTNTDWVMLFNKWLRFELVRYKFPAIEIPEDGMSLDIVLDLIK